VGSIKETTVDPENSGLVEWKCQKAIVAFFRCLDECNYPGLLARMHPEGVWLRQGKQLKGERQIMEAMHARSETLRVCHILTNVTVDVHSESGRASLFGYLLVFRHDDGKKHKGPAPLGGPSSINACNAEFRPIDGDWRIFRIENIPTLMAQE